MNHACFESIFVDISNELQFRREKAFNSNRWEQPYDSSTQTHIKQVIQMLEYECSAMSASVQAFPIRFLFFIFRWIWTQTEYLKSLSCDEGWPEPVANFISRTIKIESLNKHFHSSIRIFRTISYLVLSENLSDSFRCCATLAFRMVVQYPCPSTHMVACSIHAFHPLRRHGR